ncbi:unnamed protein product [Camellia sinensis]
MYEVDFVLVLCVNMYEVEFGVNRLMLEVETCYEIE